MAAILLLPVTEIEILETILEGLHQTQRSCFLFQAPPHNFAELDRLCVADQNMACADSMRKTPAHSKYGSVAHVPVQTPGSCQHDCS